MLLIWFNPKKQVFYQKALKTITNDYHLDFVNVYDHVLVQIIIIRNNKLNFINSFSNYYYDHLNKRQRKEYKHRIISYLIKILDRLDD